MARQTSNEDTFCWSCGFSPCCCGRDCSQAGQRARAVQSGGLTKEDYQDYDDYDYEPLPEE